MKLRYTYRARIGKQAERAIMREWGACRWVWNQMVEENRKRHEQGLEFGDKQAQEHLTRLRAETTSENGERWLAAGSNVAQQQTVRDYSRSRRKAIMDRKRHSGSKAGLPSFKSRNTSLPSLNYTKRGFRLKTMDGRERLILAKGVRVNVVWSRPLPSEPSSVRIRRDAAGDWWASFVVDVDEQQLPATNNAIGIDWGVKAVANTTNPEYDLPAPEFLSQSLHELRDAQRRMARRRPDKGKPASNGYRQAKRAAAKTYRNVRNQRLDAAHKWANKIVRDFDHIAIEDFHPAFLAKTTMARKAADNLIGATKRILLEKSARTGREVKKVPAPYTTMTCSACGARAKRRLKLDERVYHCAYCGYICDRDLNAARNIRKEAGFNLPYAEGVRRQPQQGKTSSEYGIPRL